MTFNKKLSYTCTSGIITYLFVANSFTAFAQEATEFWNERHRFNHVNNLYHQQLYRAANLSSLNFSSDDNAFYKKDYSLHLKDQIELVGALAGLKFNQLPHHTPIDVLAADNDRLNAAFGSYYYKKKDWSSAINYLSNINNANLSNNDIAAIKFELAYAYFNNKQFKEAKDLFEVIKNTPGTNQHAAKYYLGLIEYNNGSYKNALENFKAIEQLPNYKNIVPYYIAEIHYFDGAKELALQKAKEIANQSEKSYYHNEVQLLIAQCLYEQEKYAQALPYFEYYHDHVDKIHKQDLYKIGYAYYKTQQFDKAIAPFKQLSSVQDNLGQTALYYLGDCYIKTGNKTNAKNAFNLASEMTFAQPITESSLLLSGKLGFELGYANEATEQLQTLINNYSNSIHSSEAANILSEQLLKSGNYSEAFQTISKAYNPNTEFLQKSAYGLAIQELQKNRTTEVAKLLNITIQNNYDPNYTAAAQFWLGEFNYKNKNYAEAIANHKLFLATNTPNTSKLGTNINRQNALITMGYSALELQEFGQAKSFFALAQDKNANYNSIVSKQATEDALLREADASFLDKDLNKALELYTKIISLNNEDVDYALFQKSIILGLTDNHTEQIQVLQQITGKKNPISKYKYEAHLALGDVFLDDNKPKDALDQFQQISEHNAKHLNEKALQKIAFTYQELKQNDKAIETYQQIISEYPQSEQKTQTLESIKDLYINTGQPDEYVKFLNKNNIQAGSQAELESIFYNSAEALYISKQYKKAIESFIKYNSQFPAGQFSIKSNFYLAESYLQLNQKENALHSFEYVLAQPWSDFKEQAAYKAANVAYQLGEFETAKTCHIALKENAISKDMLKTAYIGLMNSSMKLNQQEASVAYIDTVSSLPNIDEETTQLIQLYRGKIAMQSPDAYQNALDFFKEAVNSKNIDIASEAAYEIANIYYLKKELTTAEAKTNEAIKLSTSSKYWNTKSYLLIASIFMEQQDYFNAKATLQSVSKNTKDTAFKQEAEQLLIKVKAFEKSKSKVRDGQ